MLTFIGVYLLIGIVYALYIDTIVLLYDKYNPENVMEDASTVLFILATARSMFIWVYLLISDIIEDAKRGYTNISVIKYMKKIYGR